MLAPVSSTPRRRDPPLPALAPTTCPALVRRDPAVPARQWLRRRWASLLVLFAAIGLVGVGDAWVATCGFAGCPSAGRSAPAAPAEGGRILDRNGRLLGRVTPVRRVNVPLSQVPVHVRQAFVAVEDRRFYAHNGTDWRSVARASCATCSPAACARGSARSRCRSSATPSRSASRPSGRCGAS
jgi:membrane peptidoglycan carboxypeptidase